MKILYGTMLVSRVTEKNPEISGKVVAVQAIIFAVLIYRDSHAMGEGYGTIWTP